MNEQEYIDAVKRVVNYLLTVSAWCGEGDIGKVHYDLSEAASIGTMRQIFYDKTAREIEQDIHTEMKRKKQQFN